MFNNTILVLEDNYPDFLRLTEQLSAFGFDKKDFYNCSSLKSLKDSAVAAFSPTFIIADLFLPDSDSPLDTYLHIKKLFNTIPVIVINNVEDEGLAMECLHEGAQNFLVKGSFTPEQLVRYITYAVERNKLKLELEKLKQDYQKIFDENPLAMFVVNSNTKRFIAVNKRAVDKYGYTEQEFFDLGLEDLQKHGEISCKTIETGVPDQSSSPFEVHINKSGQVIYAELTTTKISYQEVDSLLIAVNDVTGKVEASQAERKAKQRLEAVFNCTNDAILLTDDSGRYVQVNQAACKMLGYNENELLSLCEKNVLVTAQENLKNQIQLSNNHSFMVELRAKNGQVLICEYSSNKNILPGLHLSIITDVTEREIARQKLEEERKNTEKILESITDCFFMVDSNWIVRYWNKAGEQLLKMPKSEIVGRNLWEVYEDARDLKLYREYHKALEEKTPVHFEDYYPTMDLWIDVSAYPAEEGLTVYFRDITDEKKQSLELLQIKNNQSVLIDSSNDLIWSIDVDMKIVSFNKAYRSRIEAFTGVQISQGLQLPLKELAPHEFLRWKDYYMRGLQGEAFSVDDMIKDRTGGDDKIFEVSFRPIFDINTYHIIGLACYSHDITERKHQQQLIEQQNKQLLASEEHLLKVSSELEKILNSSLDIICSFDEHGRFLQLNKASIHLLGYTPEEMIGRPAIEFVDPLFIKKTIKDFSEIKSGAYKTNVESCFVHKNGSLIPMVWSARWDEKDKLMFGVGRDASAIKEAEKQKQEAEQRFTALVHKGADMVAVLDPLGNYLYVSPNTETILGYAVDDLLKKNALDYLHPDDYEMALTELGKIANTDELKISAFRYRHSNGSWRWMETLASNALDNPAINGIILNTRDITNRKQIETERELMITELLKSNADLKQFSFITSHNLRAPLSNIKGILNIVNYQSLDDYNKQMLEMLQTSANQLGQTIDDLIKILIIKNNVNIELSTVNLMESFQQVNTIYLNALNDVCANTSTDFQVETIFFNKTYFESILVNLMSNAIKYRSLKRSLQIKISSEMDELGNTIIKFSDNGSGIDLNRHKSKVFGLYQRFHDNVEGQGLGLFIVNSQISALGGNIEIESEPDKGTTFIITFRSQPR